MSQNKNNSEDRRKLRDYLKKKKEDIKREKKQEDLDKLQEDVKKDSEVNEGRPGRTWIEKQEGKQ